MSPRKSSPGLIPPGGIRPGLNFAAPWAVYIVRCRDGTLYTGVTNDLEARVAAHNAGAGARYTRSRRPVRLVYCEAAGNRSVAQTREHAIKRLSRIAKLTLVRAARRQNRS